MDNYLSAFSEQLDIEFKPETLFPEKKFYIMIWLKRKFIIRKHVKKQLRQTSMINNAAKIEYV